MKAVFFYPLRKKYGDRMTNNIFIKADEIAAEMGVSKPYAYKLVKKLNEELEGNGYITIPGRVSRQYYREKVYCGIPPAHEADGKSKLQEGNCNGSV